MWAFFFFTTYEHVVVEHLLVYCSPASTAQKSTAQSARTSRKSSTCPSECDNASRHESISCTFPPPFFSFFILRRMRKHLLCIAGTSYIAVPQAQHSTGLCAISPKAAMQVRADQRSECLKQASRVCESQHMSSSTYTAR